MKNGKLLRVTFSILAITIGIILVLIKLPADSGNRISELLTNLGLAFMVTGVVSTFAELALKPFQSEESNTEIADKVHQKFIDVPPSSRGIKLVSDVRRGFDDYYKWAINNDAQNLFFAGRSVLHRIDSDFKERGIPSAAERLAWKLSKGSEIIILFLDPRSELIKRLAEEEGQSMISMLQDIKTSLNVCKELFELLEKTKVSHRARLSIRIYDQVPYFAFHKEDDKIVVGYYFSTSLGYKSSAYEILDHKNKDFFQSHFTSIYDKAKEKNNIIELTRQSGRAEFNQELYNELVRVIDLNISPKNLHIS